MSTLESQVKDDEQKNSNLKKKILDFCKVSEAQTDIRLKVLVIQDTLKFFTLSIIHFNKKLIQKRKKMD